MGKRTIVKSFLEQKSADEPQPDDWCYVNNFDNPHQPRALRLPAGRGAKLVLDLGILLEDLRAAIPAALQMEEHRSRLLEAEEEVKERQSKAFQHLAEKAEERGIQLIRTPAGFALAPLRNGEVLSPEEYEKLNGEQREQIQAAVEELQNELRALVEKLPLWRNEIRRKAKEINQEATRFVVGQSLAQLRKWYTDLPQVLKYLDALEANVIQRADEFRPPDEEAADPLEGLAQTPPAGGRVPREPDRRERPDGRSARGLLGAPQLREPGRARRARDANGDLGHRLYADQAGGAARGQRRLPGRRGRPVVAAAVRLGGAQAGAVLAAHQDRVVGRKP